MKTQTIHSLITARTLFDEAMRLIESDERHMCSAGLVMLQDALEIIFLAMLTEKGVDERTSLESKSFDELIGDLRGIGVTVPKSGTLKALNKQRVITKHYGQLAEPVTVRNYANAAEVAIATVLPQVLGKSLQDVFLSDLLNESEAREFLMEASKHIQAHQPLEALIAIRKAVYVEIEQDYAVNDWIDGEDTGALGLMTKGGWKAPSWTRKAQWIRENVKDPLDYVQVDHERVRLDSIEWGISTADLENLRRLTPRVFRPGKESKWHVGINYDYARKDATLGNATYCLDRAIFVLLRKQQHARASRSIVGGWDMVDLSGYLGSSLLEKASLGAPSSHFITSEYQYMIQQIVTGFDGETKFYDVVGYRRRDRGVSFEVANGYLQVKPEIIVPLIQSEDIS